MKAVIIGGIVGFSLASMITTHARLVAINNTLVKIQVELSKQ